jgi:IS5 family transposase
MSQPRDDRQDDLFRSSLEAIINLRHPLVRLAAEINWDFLAKRFSSVCRVGPGQPPLPTRLVAGLFILKHMHNLSDEALCDRWVENPYFQYFCGEVVFRHELPFDRSSLTRWRQRLGEEQIAALLQESLSVAHRSGAIATKDLERVVVDTTVQEKAIAHPTDARLTHRAIEKLVDLAKREGVKLRQSYLRVAKRAAILVGRYTHAHQFKRARRQLKFLHTRLGRIIRDLRRKIEGNTALEDRFGTLLDLASRVRHQEQRQRGPKVYSLHAPEVECIGRGKARAPYEFGCKVSIVTPVTAPKGGQFVLHAKALHGNPLRRSYTWSRRRRSRKAYRGCRPRHPRRQGLSRSQLSGPVQGLDHRPGPACHQGRSPRDATPSCRRARDRPSQARSPYGSQLSQGP